MRLPAWFLAHGAPTHALAEGPVAAFWRALPAGLPARPRAVLVVSAHWEMPRPTLAGHVARPRIRHDFSGFPEALYRIRWPLPDARAAGAEVRGLLREAGVAPAEAPERPLDHGVWVPLLRAWPEDPPPVLQLSLVAGWTGADYRALGMRLRALAAAGVLVVGSGGLVHNLAALDRDAPPDAPAPWAARFLEALLAALAARDDERLLDPWRLPFGRRAHPTREHYWPWLVVAGFAQGALEPVFARWEHGTLAMHAFAAPPPRRIRSGPAAT